MADKPTFDPAGSGLAALLLVSNLITRLRENGTISDQEAKDVVDFALLQVEESEMAAENASSSPRLRYARIMLDELRERLGSRSRSSKST